MVLILVPLSYSNYLDFSFMTILRNVATNFSNSFYFLQIICLSRLMICVYVFILCHYKRYCLFTTKTKPSITVPGTLLTFIEWMKLGYLCSYHIYRYNEPLLIILWKGLDHRLSNQAGNPHSSRCIGLQRKVPRPHIPPSLSWGSWKLSLILTWEGWTSQ